MEGTTPGALSATSNRYLITQLSAFHMIRREIEAREAERGVFKDAPELVEDIVATLKQVRKYGIPGNCSVVRTVVLHKMEVHGVRHLLHNGFKCSLSFCRRFVANRLAGIVLRQQKAQSLPLDYEELGRMMMSILNWDGLPVDAQ